MIEVSPPDLVEIVLITIEMIVLLAIIKHISNLERHTMNMEKHIKLLDKHIELVEKHLTKLEDEIEISYSTMEKEPDKK